jgi:hypothetical protein
MIFIKNHAVLRYLFQFEIYFSQRKNLFDLIFDIFLFFGNDFHQIFSIATLKKIG